MTLDFKMDSSIINPKIDRFSELVLKEFAFLEIEHGYTINNLEKLDFEYPKDMSVRLLYTSKFIAIDVRWYLMNASMGVGLYEMKDGSLLPKYSFYGDEGYGKAIDLNMLVEYKTKGLIKNPLLEVGKRGAWIKRDKLINDKMGELLHTYAQWLKEYANEIIKGNTTIFPEIHELSMSKLEKY
jgi:hypothetical protein